jgi:hypothetical protein
MSQSITSSEEGIAIHAARMRWAAKLGCLGRCPLGNREALSQSRACRTIFSQSVDLQAASMARSFLP